MAVSLAFFLLLSPKVGSFLHAPFSSCRGDWRRGGAAHRRNFSDVSSFRFLLAMASISIP
jgi:hypothetical protein